ncbi:OmpA family protein [Brucella sp. NBRC 12950]|uniref:OmpA family protein n=1 Tax=Brucella sp. NBRC 12950 TaxID=2994518 RepID=UPI0024A5A53E|nr:OmpA family protein [Brucella sp. NBRC 12950]GLU29999.1 membrane protein [Brucella sp. NBRC 12950]
MTIRSRLLATVVLPAFSASMMMQPVHAETRDAPFVVAQDSGEQPSDDEALRQRQAEEMQQAAEEARKQAEEQQRAAEEENRRNAEEQQRAAQEEADRQAAEQQRAAEQAQRDAAEAQRAVDEQNALEEEARRKQAEDAARQAEEDQKAAEEQAKREAEQQQKAADEQEQRQADELKQAEDKARREAAEQQTTTEQQQTIENEAKRQAGEEADKVPLQKQPEQPEQPEQPLEQSSPEEKPDLNPQPTEPADAQPVVEPAAPVDAEPKAANPETNSDQPPASSEQPSLQPQQPNTEQEAEQPVTDPLTEPKAEIVDERTKEQQQEIAKDPSSTDDTVVLPVENGAAVLDSDKDADNFGGNQSREERRKSREQQRATEEKILPPPVDDASAQVDFSDELKKALPQKIEANLKEDGTRIKEAPAFAVPETTNIINNTIINNTTVNNTTVNNNVTNVKVVEQIDNRVILDAGDRIFVRGDDRPRLRRDAQETYYDELPRGRLRETIVRPGGYEIVTVYDRYGDIVQRSRIDRDGNEYLMIYAPEYDETPRAAIFDVGYDLPPMRLTIPVQDYIIDVADDPERDFYDFLALPPVERVERVYTIDEVRHSARLRDKVRRIDLDTIHFATGSAEVSLSQAKTLRKVATAMQKVLAKDPGETFFIEGHTDAVGSDRSNLVLSDRRAESVASLLTEVYDIPAENLVTQGYGERFLKIRTQAAEQENRRVTIRRVTPLVRPVAQR